MDTLSKEQFAILNVLKNELNSRSDFGVVDWKHSEHQDKGIVAKPIKSKNVYSMDDLILDFPELTNIKGAWDDVPDEFRSEVSKAVMQHIEEHGVVGGGQDIIDLINKVAGEGTTLRNKGVLKKKPSDKSKMYPPPKNTRKRN